MTLTSTILLMALATFALRLSGFLLPAGPPEGFVSRWLRSLPLAVFGTLIGTSVAGPNALDTTVRIAAMAVAAWLLARRTPLWLVLGIVMGGYVCLRVLSR